MKQWISLLAACLLMISGALGEGVTPTPEENDWSLATPGVWAEPGAPTAEQAGTPAAGQAQPSPEAETPLPESEQGDLPAAEQAQPSPEAETPSPEEGQAQHVPETEQAEPSPTAEQPSVPATESPEAMAVEAAAAEPLYLRFTPSTTSPWDGQDLSLNYWTLPMDIGDEAAVWQVLMSPITVVDNGKGEKSQIVLRAEPSADSLGVGCITCSTQGVHVLQRGEEWSLVECYSSSFHDSQILNWNALVQGYVPTEYLKEETPNQELGMVIDKLTQRLYIFREGRLFSTLLVSTGLSNARQPYNETRSGEFLLTSKVGTFMSDNLSCGLAIRFNRGDLLHEVPAVQNEDGTSNYRACEIKLGAKASHGCIRVQRKKTPEGVNMAWIWAALKNNSKTRLLIWEDWQGRQIRIPAEDSLLYYNPNKGEYYHSKETCNCTRAGVTLKAFEYGRLDEKRFARLKRCEYCAPALRKKEIEKINAAYAFGEDHDPVLTEARQDCPKPLK